jgi:hypothetical protein
MGRSFQVKSLMLVLLFLGACNPAQPVETTTAALLQPTEPFTATALPAPTGTATATLPPASTNTSTLKPTNTPTPTVTNTLIVTPEPTYVLLRGEVNQKHVSCFYGPSKTYLYKYGLLKGNRLDIIGYIADTGYIEVQAIGGNNPCWMNMEWMDVQGDINLVQPIDPLEVKLPQSPYYGALTWVKASRSANDVTITWEELGMSPGDDSEQEPYLVEAWVCRDGKLTFVPIGVYCTEATIVDEPGCSEPSFGRVYGVEKHGYTKPREIPWPQAGDQGQ